MRSRVFWCCFPALLLPSPHQAAGDGKPTPTVVEPAPAVATLGAWQELVFTASKWGMSSRSIVRRERLGEGRWRLEIESSYLGRSSKLEVRFDDDGIVKESISWRASGRSSYWNRRVYGTEGIRRWRKTPVGKSEAASDPSDWSQVEEKVEPYPPGIAPCGGITETPVLLHLVSVAAEKIANLCFLSGGGAFKIDVEEHPEEELLTGLAPALTPVTADGEALESTQVWRLDPRAKRLQLRPRSLSGDSASLRLLGLQGDLTIYLGTRTPWPLRIQGRAPWAGKLEVTLVEALFLISGPRQ